MRRQTYSNQGGSAARSAFG